MKWLRLYYEFATYPKIQSMDETLQRRYIMLLCLKGNGDLEKLDENELAFALRISKKELEETKKVFTEKEFIENGWCIRAWNDRQFQSDDVNIRMKRHRSKMKRNSNVTVTAPDTDTESEQIKNSICTEKKDCNNNNEVAASAADIKSVVSDLTNSKRAETKKQDKSFIIDLLKKIGIPGNVSYDYTNRYPTEYLCRKIFLLEYYKSNGTEVKNDVAFLRSAIEYDNEKFPEYDDFHEWFKMRKEQIMDDDKTPHQLKQIIGRT
jgi:hypothetical protein